MCPRTGMLRSTLVRSSERAPMPEGPEPAGQVDAGRDEPTVRLPPRETGVRNGAAVEPLATLRSSLSRRPGTERAHQMLARPAAAASEEDRHSSCIQVLAAMLVDTIARVHSGADPVDRDMCVVATRRAKPQELRVRNVTPPSREDEQWALPGA